MQHVFKTIKKMATTNKISSEESKQIAATILQQLGGRRFMMMTGSKPKYCDQYKSTYELTRNKAGAKYMEITLNGRDLYDIILFSVNAEFERTIKAEHNNIYCDQLQSTFTELTGLYTHL